MTPDARDLLAACHGGPNGHAAFARIYDRHSPVVLALCRQHVSHRSDAEADDALQETFIRAFRMLDKLADPDQLRPWLYAIARRVCSERRRSAIRRARHEARGATVTMNAALDHSPLPGRASDATQAPLPPVAAERAEQLALLDKALNSLPDKERLAIHLYYLDTDPVAAAQSSLGLSRSGFYKLLTRAREHLAALMAEAHTT